VLRVNLTAVNVPVDSSVLPSLLRSKSLSAVTYVVSPYVPLSDGLVALVNHPNVRELHHLELEGRWDRRDDIARLTHFSQLQFISLTLGSAVWTISILDGLSQLSQLTDLHIDLKDAYYDWNQLWYIAPPQNNSQKVSFPTLRKLMVVGSPALIFIVLNHIVANHLQHIHICFAHFITRADCSRLYQSISRFRSLRKIAHTLNQNSSPQDPP
jgi:hypothetical protein